LSNSSSGTSNRLPTLKSRNRFSSGVRLKGGAVTLVKGGVADVIAVFVRGRERVVEELCFSSGVRSAVVRLGLGLLEVLGVSIINCRIAQKTRRVLQKKPPVKELKRLSKPVKNLVKKLTRNPAKVCEKNPR